MKITPDTRILILTDAVVGAYKFQYAFDCVPAVIDSLGYPTHELNVESATLESFKQAVSSFRPDLIFGYVQKHHLIIKVAQYLEDFHPVPVINWFFEDPNGVFDPDKGTSIIDSTGFFDYWFSQDNNMKPFWKTKSAFIPPAFNDAVYNDLGLPRDFDVSYIGQLGPRYITDMYWPYMKELSRYGRRAMMCINRPMGIPLLPWTLEKFIRSPKRRGLLQKLPVWKCGWMNPADELEKCKVINRSKIHFGMVRLRGVWEETFKAALPTYPIDRSGLFYQPKGRLFQAVGGRAMGLNEYSPELEELFEIGKEIVTFEYGEIGDLREKLKFYVTHDNERERIATAGFERGRKQHTFTHRVRQILDIVAKEL